jgi:hypothetical protein
MLILNPRAVRFGASLWDDVTAIAIDRAAKTLVEEWSDAGPYQVTADVAEQRITIKVVQDIVRDDIAAPRPGDEGALTFYTAPAQSDAGRRKVSTIAVVVDVAHELSLKRGAVRTVTLVAESADGAADPIQIQDATGGGP